MVRLVALSQPFVGSEPILTIQDDEPEFRLHIMTKMLSHLRDGTQPTSIDEGAGKEHIFIPGTRILTHYLRRAKAVLALAARLGAIDEMRELVAIRHDGERIAWKDFFYSADDLSRLYYYLNHRSVTHPVAVAIQVKRIVEKTEHRPQWLIGCHHQTISIESERAYVSPSIRGDDDALKKFMVKDGWYLLCAVPSLGAPKPSTQSKFVNINFHLLSRHQICRYQP